MKKYFGISTLTVDCPSQSETEIDAMIAAAKSAANNRAARVAAYIAANDGRAVWGR